MPLGSQVVPAVQGAPGPHGEGSVQLPGPGPGVQAQPLQQGAERSPQLAPCARHCPPLEAPAEELPPLEEPTPPLELAPEVPPLLPEPVGIVRYWQLPASH